MRSPLSPTAPRSPVSPTIAAAAGATLEQDLVRELKDLRECLQKVSGDRHALSEALVNEVNAASKKLRSEFRDTERLLTGFADLDVQIVHAHSDAAPLKWYERGKGSHKRALHAGASDRMQLSARSPLIRFVVFVLIAFHFRE